MQAPAPVRRSDNGESMLNRRSIPKAGRRVSPQRRLNAGLAIFAACAIVGALIEE